jgi:aminopeptidase N
MRFHLSTFCAAITVAAIVSVSADTYPRQPAIDVIHYRFGLTITEGSNAIVGEAQVIARLVTRTPELALDLIGAAGDKGMTVERVTSDKGTVAFTHQSDRLRLPIPPAAQPGEEVTFSIAYRGTPALGLQFLKNLHGESVAFSENWPNRARHWLPMVDHPYDKATGEFIVTAPAQYQVVANGVLVEEVDLGNARRRTHWKQSVPIASWLYALGIARFDVHHAGSVLGVPLQTWVFPQDRGAGRELFEETSRQAIALFTNRVGPYPYEKLANVQAAGYAGGMENATVIFYGEKGVAAGRGPVVHEIAHQWFGNSVTERDWDDVWLSEGFATYFALLFTEHYRGRDAFVADLQRSRATVLGAERKTTDTPIVHRNLSDMEKVLNPFVYQKGGWVLHMLRGEIGTDTFWRGIQEYYRRYRDRNASTDDLRQVMESVSGKDLRWFFTQWLTRSGIPRVEHTWQYDAARKTIDVTLAQTHSGAPFRLRVDVAVLSSAGRRVETIELDSAQRRVSIASDVPPISVVIDPDTWLLAEFER